MWRVLIAIALMGILFGVAVGVAHTDSGYPIQPRLTPLQTPVPYGGRTVTSP